MDDDAATPPIDPREFCLLLQQVDREPPRRSRDMEPDLIGIGIKQRILEAVLVAPPAAADFAPVLLESAAALDLPPGVTRGVCSDILLEWQMAHSSPAFMDWLRAEAAQPAEPRRKRRAERDGEPAWRARPERGFGGPTEQH